MAEIQVIAPDGTLGTIPADKEQDWLGRGPDFKIFNPTKPAPTDLVNDGKEVQVRTKSGESGTIPVEKLTAPEFKDNFTLKSIADSNDQYNQKVDNLHKALLDPETKFPTYHNADLQQDGKWKMEIKNPDGSVAKFLVPPEKLVEYHNAGATFQDKNFQALIDAQKKLHSPTGKPEDVSSMDRAKATAIGDLNTLLVDVPEKLQKKAIATGDPSMNNFDRARYLSMYWLFQNDPQLSTSHKAGAIAGIPTSLLAGGGAGVFGEVAAAGKVGRAAETAIMAGRTVEEASLARTLLAKGVGTFTEGAGLASPTAFAQVVFDKNPKLAIETLALGGGLNMGFKGLGAVGKSLVKDVENARLGAAAREIGLLEESTAKLGNASQQKAFLETLGEKGLGKAGAAEKTIPTLEKMAAGEALTSIATKLAPSAEKVSASALVARLEELGQAASKVTKEAQVEGLTKFSKEVTPFVETVSKTINKLADKEGNLSLPQVVSLAEKVGAEKAEGALASIKKDFHSEVMQSAFKAGDAAIEKLDAKVNAEWAQAKYNQQVASELIKPEFAAKMTQAAEEVGTKEGKHVAETLVEKAFDYAKHQGVHLVSGALGHAMGPIGGVVGYGISKAASALKNVLLDSYISNPRNASKLTGWLGKQATNENLASYLVMDSVHAVQSKLDKIGDVLSKSAVKASTADHSNAIKEVLGSSVNGLSKQQQFAKISDHLATAASQPDLTASTIRDNSSILQKDHLPLSEQYQAHMMNKMQYLYSILPKDPTGKQPFTKDEKWQPTPAELDHFQRQLTLAQDPFYVLDLVKDNTISERDVATLSVLNPEILQMMRSEITKIAYSGKIDLPYQQKLSLSVLMGENMVSALNNIPLNQSIYGPVDNSSSPSPQGVTAPKQSGKGGSHIKAENISQMTPSQRIMGK